MEKIKWLSILQGWAMLWVVIGHSTVFEVENTTSVIDSIWYSAQWVLHDFAYTFHMSLLFLISGYLLYKTKIGKNKSYKSVLKSKFNRFFLPYVIFITLAIVVKYITGCGDRQLNSGFTGFVNNYLYPYDGALREMWFLAVLFWLILLYPLYRLLIQNRLYSVVGCVILIVIYIIGKWNLPHFLQICFVPRHLLLYYIGIMIAHYKVENYLKKNITIFVCGSTYIISMIYNLYLLFPIMGSFFFLGLALKIESKLPCLFSSFRDYIYQIFLMGIFFQILIKVLYEKFYVPNIAFAAYIVCALVGLYFPVLISKLVVKSKSTFFKKACGL